MIEETSSFSPQFEKEGGTVPVVVQESQTGEVLMVARADREAVEKTLSTGYATFFSRSRGTLWTKGETSGNHLIVEEMRVDCDQDALLYRVTLKGTGVCHTRHSSGAFRKSCFYREVVDREELRWLAE